MVKLYVTDIVKQIAGISVRKTQRAVSRTNEHRRDNYERVGTFCLFSAREVSVCVARCPISTAKTTIDRTNKDPSVGYVTEILKLDVCLTSGWKFAKSSAVETS